MVQKQMQDIPMTQPCKKCGGEVDHDQRQDWHWMYCKACIKQTWQGWYKTANKICREKNE